MIALFFSPTCGPCKSLMPAFKRVVKKDKLEHELIDSSTECGNSHCSMYGINSFPTILFIHNDKIVGYQQGFDTSLEGKKADEWVRAMIKRNLGAHNV
jgi:thiol-disulfide isomerase/thioredoxin